MSAKRAIVVGLGGRGLHWVRHVAEHPGIELVGYAEPVEAMRARAMERAGVDPERIAPSLDEALDRFPADFVVDVTPPAAHASVARTAFAAGLDVLQEKPLSDDFETARQIVAEGAAAGRRHMVTQNYRFGAFPRTTRALLAQGLIGVPGQCDLRFAIPWADLPGSHYTTQPYMLINDMMVHHFDLMRYVLQQDPVWVQAVAWNHPWGWHVNAGAHCIVFGYDSGLMATHVACGCAVGSQTGWNGDWRIEGPLGSIDWSATAITHHHLHRTEQRIQREVPFLEVPPGERAILDEFLSAIDQGRDPECSAADNLRSLAMVFAAIRSAREEGRRVRVDTP